MKKVLLGLSILTGLAASAQTFTIDDTLSAGDSQNYFVVDSNAVNYDAITGSGVTWDYSAITGYSGSPTNLDTVQNASSSPHASSFPAAVYVDNMAGGNQLFFKNYLDSVMVHGYVFDVDTYTITIKHDVDALKMLDLPMNLSDTYTDYVSGTIDVVGAPLPINGEPQDGTVTVTADGTGTLIVGSTTFTNVIRIKLVETLTATITVPPFPTQTGYVTRTVYSYYDLANQNMPVFLHADINVVATGFGGNFTAVYSSVDVAPASGAGISTAELEADFTVFPNPTTDFVQVTSSQNTDELNVINELGQVVIRLTNPKSIENINVSTLEKGVYIIQLNKGSNSVTKKLVIK